MERLSESPDSIIHRIFELLRDHCTGDDEGRRLFVRKCAETLTNTMLSSDLSEAASWAKSWDKPLYANQSAEGGTRVAERIRRGSTALDDPAALPTDPELLKGLRDPVEKLARLHALGARWPEIHALHCLTASQVGELFASLKTTEQVAVRARELVGAPGYRSRQTRGTLFDQVTSIRGYGGITALHLLMDLGYPVYKPDRWLIRFAAADPTCRRELARRLDVKHKAPMANELHRLGEGFLMRNLDLVCFAVDSLTERFLTEAPPIGIDARARSFNAYRLVDLMVAKFGMKPESAFGLKMSGMQFLLSANRETQVLHPELLSIAQEMGTEQRLRAEKKKRS
jgi:hypothetical protein